MKIRRFASVLVLDLLLVSACSTTPAGSSSPSASDTKTFLHFENAPLFDVAIAVSERTGNLFVIDPGLKGSITLIVPASAAEPQVLAFFRAALAQAGLDALPIDGGLRILARSPAAAPAADTATEPARVAADEFIKAAGSGTLDVVQRYLREGGNPNAVGRGEETALMTAASGGHLGVVRELAEHGAALNYPGTGFRGSPPLLRALEYRHLEIARFLLERSEDIPAETRRDNSTPLKILARNKDAAILKPLLLQFANPRRGMSALMLSARNKNAALVKLLLARGASTRESTEDGQQPLHFAAAAGDPATTALLLEAGAPLRFIEGKSPAAAAARVGSRETLELLAKRGVDLDAALVEIAAQEHDSSKAIPLLLAAGARPGARNRQGRTALMLAAGCGSREGVQLLLQAGAEVAARDPEGLTALLHSFRNDAGARALTGRSLVDVGAEINARDGYGRTALHYAALRSSGEGVLYLLSKKADHAAQDEEGNTALHYATQGRTPELASLLLDAGANPEIRNALGQSSADLANRAQKQEDGYRPRQRTPGGSATSASARFTEAANRGDDALVLAMLAKGQNPNCFAPGMPTALQGAAGRGSLEIVRALVEAGAAIEFRGEGHLEPPILKAARALHLPVVAYLLDKGVSLQPTLQGESPLVAVAGSGDLALTKRLLELGADPEAADRGLGALHAAAAGGHTEVVALLMKAGADPNDLRGSGSKPPLAYAAAMGQEEAAKLLLDAGADPATALLAVAADVRGDEPAYGRFSAAVNFATGENRLQNVPQAIGRLVAAAGKADVRDARGETPLLAAVRAGNAAAVQSLLDLKADVHAVNLAGQSALHIAMATSGRSAIVQTLVAAGAPLNGRDGAGRTALMSAAGNVRGENLVESVILLVQKGAEVNAADDAGDTPLHYSVRAGSTNTALLLLQAGADRTRRNFEGKRPVDLATGRGAETLRRTLSLADPAPAPRPSP